MLSLAWGVVIIYLQNITPKLFLVIRKVKVKNILTKPDFISVFSEKKEAGFTFKELKMQSLRQITVRKITGFLYIKENTCSILTMTSESRKPLTLPDTLMYHYFPQRE